MTTFIPKSPLLRNTVCGIGNAAAGRIESAERGGTRVVVLRGYRLIVIRWFLAQIAKNRSFWCQACVNGFVDHRRFGRSVARTDPRVSDTFFPFVVLEPADRPAGIPAECRRGFSEFPMLVKKWHSSRLESLLRTPAGGDMSTRLSTAR